MEQPGPHAPMLQTPFVPLTMHVVPSIVLVHAVVLMLGWHD
jgi:hypothetical protein